MHLHKLRFFTYLTAAIVWIAPTSTRAVTEPATGKMTAFAWEECPLAPLTDMGALNGFYRNTQLQGHLVQDGLYLDTVPAFWMTGSDFPYRKKESEKEVFFVDEFSVVRFLGGFPQQWKHGGNQLPTNDMAYLDDKGKLCYRLDLVRSRLDPYIKNGYTHFTIQLGNVPWAMSRDPSKSGPFGVTEPPRDWKEWRELIRALCGEIKAVYPQEVLNNLRFKIGNEYNTQESFSGSFEDFLKLYDYSAAAIQEVFPKAHILPGEFAGGAGAGSNEISYVKLFNHFTGDRNRAGATTPPAASALVRSTHSFPFARDIGPRERVRSALGSFREVLAGKPEKLKKGLSFEYHQYGVLGTRFDDKIIDVGVRAASWQFQVMFRSRAAGYLDKCWAWDKSESIAKDKSTSTHFLNSIGWLYSILDHLRGDHVWLVEPLQPQNSKRDVTAAVFTNDRRVVVLLASWAPADDQGGPMTVRLKIPGKTLPFVPDLKQARMVAFDNGTSFFGAARRDLEKEGNLKAVFAQNPEAIGTVRDMAQDYPAARAMIFRQLEKYIGIQQQSLTLQPLPEGKLALRNPSGPAVLELDAQLAPDDLSVIVFDRTPPNSPQ
jgi:hypothetical protein